jgi:hypothetical protein
MPLLLRNLHVSVVALCSAVDVNILRAALGYACQKFLSTVFIDSVAPEVK